MKEKYRSLYAAGKTEEEALKRLVEIIRVLRVECPWDRVQTHETLKKCMLEEAYEAVEAINRKDEANLREELGDVLLQVVFHSLLSEEERDFTLTEVINGECEKMIRRHPHIFSEEEIKTVDKLLERWENIKSREHAEQSYTERLRNVPTALPALMRSAKIQSKASRVGFDWKDASGAFDKLEEEIGELREAYEGGEKSAIAEEFGDLLFSMVNVSRFLDIDPEESLNGCSEKFIRRFEFIEKSAQKRGLSFDRLTAEEMDSLWTEAKEKENKA